MQNTNIINRYMHMQANASIYQCYVEAYIFRNMLAYETAGGVGVWALVHVIRCYRCLYLYEKITVLRLA